MISGVRTCGGGAGYCLLGLDCTLDEDFLPDNGEGQHCEGLRSAFTPSAHFVCCRAANHPLPGVPSTTAPLDVLENEVGQVLQKVAESVEAAQRTPAPGAELRDTLLEEEVLESSLEGGVLQGEDDSEEEMQQDEEFKDTNYEQDHASMDEELYQNDSPVDVLQEPKIEDSSEEKSTESSDSSEEDSSSSSEEIDSDEVLTTTNTNVQKPSPSQESPTVPETQNDLKGGFEEDNIEDNTEGGVSQSNEISQEESETTTASPEENATDPLMSKETLSVLDESDLDVFQSDENTKQPTVETSNPLSESKKITSTEKLDISKYQTTSQNPTESSYSKLDKTKAKPPPPKKPINKEGSKASGEDASLNEVVLTTTHKKAEENSLHNAIYPPEKQAGEGIIRTNKTTVDSQTDRNTQGGFATATEASVYPGQEQASVRPGGQGQAGVGCSRTRTNTTDCSPEIRFVFENRTLCFGAVYSLDWVVTSASCALRSVSKQFNCKDIVIIFFWKGPN